MKKKAKILSVTLVVVMVTFGFQIDVLVIRYMKWSSKDFFELTQKVDLVSSHWKSYQVPLEKKCEKIAMLRIDRLFASKPKKSLARYPLEAALFLFGAATKGNRLRSFSAQSKVKSIVSYGLILQHQHKVKREVRAHSWMRELLEVYVDHSLSRSQLLHFSTSYFAFYFGEREVVGVQKAAKKLFSKSPSSLKVHECAYLMGFAFLKKPRGTRFSIGKNVLLQMKQYGYLNKQEYHAYERMYSKSFAHR